MIYYYQITECSSDDYQLSGNGNKKILILIRKNDLNPATNKMLRDMIKAIRYDLNEDIFLLQLHKEKININELPEYQKSDYFISFGVSAENLNLNLEVPNYYPIEINKKTILMTELLSYILNDKKSKMNLWKCLQSMFLRVPTK